MVPAFERMVAGVQTSATTPLASASGKKKPPRGQKMRGKYSEENRNGLANRAHAKATCTVAPASAETSARQRKKEEEYAQKFFLSQLSFSGNWKTLRESSLN